MFEVMGKNDGFKETTEKFTAIIIQKQV